MNSKDSIVTIVGVLILLISLAGAFVAGAPEEPVTRSEGVDLTGKVSLEGDLAIITGYGDENSETNHAVTIEHEIIESVRFTLTWSDEPDLGPRYTNGPDAMSLEVGAPDGTVQTAGPGQGDNDVGGSLVVDFSYPEPRRFEDTTWVVTITVGECGDQELRFSPLNIRDEADDGNPYAVQGEVTYWARKESSGSGAPAGGGEGVDMMGPPAPWYAPRDMSGSNPCPCPAFLYRPSTAGVGE